MILPGTTVTIRVFLIMVLAIAWLIIFNIPTED